MKIRSVHSWKVLPREAVSLQISLRHRIICRDDFDLRSVKRVAGADVSYAKENNLIFAVVAVFSYPGLDLLEEQFVTDRIAFPYVPGLLVFREGPPLLKAFEKISKIPDVIMFDGHGVSHPRGIGVASHLGIWLNKPAIGVAKTVLCGEYQEPLFSKGSISDLIDHGKVIGKTVRTRNKVKPVFVSIGHRIGLETAVQLTLACSAKYRLPEPIRYAHLAANRLRSATLSSGSSG